MKRSKASVLICFFFYLRGKHMCQPLLLGQKSWFWGGIRDIGVGFSIGTKGYVELVVPCRVHWYLGIWSDNKCLDTDGTHIRFRQIWHGWLSIGHKGYIGIGMEWCRWWGNQYRDFWEYNPITNTGPEWRILVGSARYSAISFVIDTKGYVGNRLFSTD